MDLHLNFANGSMSGDGNDDVGRFIIRGKYDTANRECYWTKTYPGSHDVYYRGFREGKGIWGTWEIGVLSHGGFHIWPKGEHDGETASATAEAAKPVEAIGKEQEAEQRGDLVMVKRAVISLFYSKRPGQVRAEHVLLNTLAERIVVALENIGVHSRLSAQRVVAGHTYPSYPDWCEQLQGQGLRISKGATPWLERGV
jgi:hypothetical protein